MPPTTILDQYGAPITRATMMKVYNSGFYFGAWGNYLNPDEFGVPEYQKMYDFDDAVQSGVDFVTLSVLSMLGEYTHPDETIQEAVRKEFETMKGSIDDVVEGLQSDSYICGFSAGEMVLTDEEGIHLREVQFLDPATINFELHKEGPEKNRIKGIQQYQTLLGGPESGSAPPPIDKFIIHSHRPKYGNPYGNSALKSVRAPQFLKNTVIAEAARVLQKLGTNPRRDVEVAPEAPPTVDIGNGQTVGLYEFLDHSLATMTNTSNFVLPQGVKINYGANPANVGDIFGWMITYCDTSIYRGLLLPGLVAKENGSGGGSRALGDTHFDLYILVIKRLRRRVVNTLLDQFVRRFILWNFGPQDTWGDFNLKELNPEQAKIMSEIFNTGCNNGYIDPGRIADFRHMRESTGLPEVSDEEFAQIQAEREAKAAAVAEQMKQAQQAKAQPPQEGPGQAKKDEDDTKVGFTRLNGIESIFAEV